jgi:hypothetical protein
MTLAGIVFWTLLLFWLIPLPLILGKLNAGIPAIIFLVLGDNLIVGIGSTLLLNKRMKIKRSIEVIPIEFEYIFERR